MGTPHLSKLRLEVSKGMLSAKTKYQKLPHESLLKNWPPVSDSSSMGRGCEESLGYRNLRSDLEVGMLEVFVEEVRKCVNS